MRVLRWLGFILIAVGVLGFLTVADDMRHTGELIGVGSIVAAGLVLVAVSMSKRWRQ